MSAAPAPPRGLTPVRWFAAAAAAAAGAFGLVPLTAALGYGYDWHAPRVAAAGAALFLGLGIALRAGVGWPSRGLALLAGLGGAAAAWWWVPAGSGGPSLAAAVADRDAAARQVAAAPPDDLAALVSLTARERARPGRFRSLYDPVGNDLYLRAEAAAAALAERFRQTSPDDLAAYLRAADDRLLLYGPPGGYSVLDPPVLAAARDWVARAVAARAAELRDLRPGDWDGFDRTAVARHALADAVPGARALLAEAEEFEVGRWTNAFLKQSEGGVVPGAWRLACGLVRDRVGELRAVDPAAERFLASRAALFLSAHEAAREECRAHLEAGRYAAAFGVARAHAVEWFATAEMLGPAERKGLADLRDGYRYLAVLAEKAGPAPDPAPAPRPRP